MQGNWNRHRTLCKAAINKIWKLDLIHFRQWQRRLRKYFEFCEKHDYLIHGRYFFIFIQVSFPCGFLRWCDSPISISQRESQPCRIFPRESIIFSPLSRQLRPPVALSCGNYCKARSRTIFGKYLGIFCLCGYMFSIVICHVSPSPQHSASAILLRWYLSKLSVDK